MVGMMSRAVMATDAAVMVSSIASAEGKSCERLTRKTSASKASIVAATTKPTETTALCDAVNGGGVDGGGVSGGGGDGGG